MGGWRCEYDTVLEIVGVGGSHRKPAERKKRTKERVFLDDIECPADPNVDSCDRTVEA